MRVLLDESLPRRLQQDLSMHQVLTVVERGWTGIQNGQLLALAATEFDVFITADQNLQYQQNLARLPLSVIVLAAPNNRLETLRAAVPELLIILKNLPARCITTITL